MMILNLVQNTLLKLLKECLNNKENNMKLQREMEINSLEQMCDLMCGGVEEDYEEELSFEEWWDRLDDIEREDYNMIMEETK